MIMYALLIRTATQKGYFTKFFDVFFCLSKRSETLREKRKSSRERAQDFHHCVSGLTPGPGCSKAD